MITRKTVIGVVMMSMVCILCLLSGVASGQDVQAPAILPKPLPGWTYQTKKVQHTVTKPAWKLVTEETDELTDEFVEFLTKARITPEAFESCGQEVQKVIIKAASDRGITARKTVQRYQFYEKKYTYIRHEVFPVRDEVIIVAPDE